MPKKQEAPDDELPVDQPEPDAMKDSDVAPSPFEDPTTDPMPHEVAEKVRAGAIAALDGTVDELHAIQVRLAEMVPFLPAAIDKATGDVKGFLQALAAHL